MNDDLKSILRQKYAAFYDLQEDVFEEALAINLINEDQYNQIMGIDVENKRIDKLLSVLLSKPDKDVEKFLSLLKPNYRWIYDLFPKSNFSEVREILHNGGVPPPPYRNVTRVQLVESVREKLHVLERGHYLVLHGMAGCGKTCLAAYALANYSLLKEVFNGKVFWVSVGSERCDLVSLQAEVNSLLPDSVQDLPRDVTQAKFALKKKWETSNLGNSLLILDDVAVKDRCNVISALDINCKTLVTTKDQNVMTNKESVSEFLKVPENFELQETKELLANSLGVVINELPRKAEALHAACKGFPMIVSQISIQLEENKESVKLSSKKSKKDHWDYYIDIVNQKNYKKLGRDSLGQNEGGILKTIGLNVDSLGDKMKSYFQDFAVFPEDVNIRPEVLSTLWSEDVYTVERWVNQFERKNLVVKKWNEHLNSFVYGIHDLFLYYLRSSLSCPIQELHRKLLKKYRNKYGKDLSELPSNDNYMFLYIGHHLKMAGEDNMFPQLYLNLAFVEAKLRAVGPTDLLTDYFKYKEEIVAQDERNKQKLMELERFVENNGQWLHNHQDIDIVQFIYQDSASSILLKEATRLSEKRNKCYIRFRVYPADKQISSENVHLTRDPEKCVTALSKTNHPENVLVGYNTGTIELWNIRDKALLKSYSEHKGEITRLRAHALRSEFLSCSLDGTARIWKLFRIGESRKLADVSPSRRQEGYFALWNVRELPGEESLRQLNHGSPVHCGALAKTKPLTALCSATGGIKMWMDEKSVWNSNEKAISCVFFHQDAKFAVGTPDIGIVVLRSSDGHVLERVPFSEPVLQLSSFPDTDSEIVVLFKNSISIWKCEPAESNASTVEKPGDFQTSKIESYSCCDASVQIIIGLSSSSILVCDRENGESIMNFGYRVGKKCVAMSVFSNNMGDVWVFAGYEDRTVWRWNLGKLSGKYTPRLQPNFKGVWPAQTPDPFLVAPTSSSTCLRVKPVCNDYSMVSIPIIGQCRAFDLSPDADMVVYVDNSGGVWKVQRFSSIIPQKIMSVLQTTHADPIVKIFLLGNQPIFLATHFSRENLTLLKMSYNHEEKILECKGDSVANIFFWAKCIISVTKNKCIQVWNLEGEEVAELLGDGAQLIDTSFAQGVLALVDSFHRVFIYSFKTPNLPVLLTEFCVALLPTCCALAPNSSCFVLGFTNGSLLVCKGEKWGEQKHINIWAGQEAVEAVCLSGGHEVGALTCSRVGLLSSDLKSSATALVSADRIIAAPHNLSSFATINTLGVINIMTLDRCLNGSFASSLQVPSTVP